MRKRILFIYNPKAGKKKIKGHLDDIITNLCGYDTELIVSPTERPGDARERVIEYGADENCIMIACSGGDGTLHEIVNGMMRIDRKLPIVYMPAGSTNDFGASLKIPKDMVEASDAAKFGVEFPCDIATFNNDYFVYTACFGIFTETSYSTPQNIKNVLGHFAYIINGMTELANIKRYKMRVQFDGKEEEGNFIFGAVCSTSSIGGVKGLTGRDIKFDDGLYEMLLIKDSGFLETPSLITDILRGKLEHKCVVYDKVKSVRFVCEDLVPWCVDGEYGGSYDDVSINVKKQAINLMVPRESSVFSEKED